MRWLHAAAVLLLLTLTCVAGEGLLLLRQARLSLVQLTADTHTEALKLDATLTDARRVELVAGGALTNIEKGGRAWEKASNIQAKYFTEAASQTNADLTTLNALLSDLRTDASSQSTNLSSLESQLTDSASQLGSLEKQTQLAVANASDASESLAKGLSQAMPGIVASAKSTADATAHADATLADMQTFIHKVTDPPKGVWHFIEHFVGWAGPTTVVAIK